MNSNHAHFKIRHFRLCLSTVCTYMFVANLILQTSFVNILVLWQRTSVIIKHIQTETEVPLCILKMAIIARDSTYASVLLIRLHPNPSSVRLNIFHFWWFLHTSSNVLTWPLSFTKVTNVWKQNGNSIGSHTKWREVHLHYYTTYIQIHDIVSMSLCFITNSTPTLSNK